jgi:hypothetical protein
VIYSHPSGLDRKVENEERGGSSPEEVVGEVRRYWIFTARRFWRVPTVREYLTAFRRSRR